MRLENGFRNEGMVRVRPPTPPSSNPDDMNHNGSHQLVRHNASTSYPRQSIEYDDGHSMQSRSQSAYGSPGPLYHDDGYRYGSQPPSYGYQRQGQNMELGNSYDGFSPEIHHFGHNRYATPVGSLPMSPSTTPDDEPIRTRSGLAINRSTQPLKSLPQSRSRAPKSPGPKSKKTNKVKKENTVAKLDRPLSELTKDWTHVGVVDIEAYVNRSVEERRKEVDQGKQPGRVKRPMNSFMLYRKAYQNRTKNWCLQNNHQVVSQVCGDSWPLEPQVVRDQFNEWARIERINHQNAHPGYKFSPSKTVAAKAGKRKASQETEDPDDSDLDYYDWKAGKTSRGKKQPKQEPRTDVNVGYVSRSPYQYSRDVSEDPNYQPYHKSSYEASNPGRPPPVQYSQSNLRPGHYYETTMRPTTGLQGAEDLMTSMRAAPPAHGQGPQGGLEYNVVDPYFQQVIPEARIDPNLVAYDQGLYYDGLQDPDSLYIDGLNDTAWHGQIVSIPGQEPEQDSLGMLEGPQDLQIHDQHLQMLKENQDAWQIESLDEGQEFDKWMD